MVAATPGGLLGASSLLAPALRTRVEPLSRSGPSGRLRCGHEARPKWLIPRLCHPQIRLPPRPHEARQTPLREGRTASFDALVLIDFGLARAFYTADGHISMRKHQGRAGTARYASMNTHRGLTQSRRDDLESIGYLLVFLHRGRLPWQGVRAASRKEKHLRICEAKARTSLPELCAAMPGMLEYLQYVRNLGFDADPDYEYLRRLFLQQGHTAPADWAGQEHLPPRAASAPRTKMPPGRLATCPLTYTNYLEANRCPQRGVGPRSPLPKPGRRLLSTLLSHFYPGEFTMTQAALLKSSQLGPPY